MATIGPQTAPSVRPGIAWVQIDDEIVALSEDAAEVHLISATGALLFQLIDGSTTVSAIAEDVADAFGIDRREAEGHVTRFIRQMHESRLIDVVMAPDAHG